MFKVVEGEGRPERKQTYCRYDFMENLQKIDEKGPKHQKLIRKWKRNRICYESWILELNSDDKGSKVVKSNKPRTENSCQLTSFILDK